MEEIKRHKTHAQSLSNTMQKNDKLHYIVSLWLEKHARVVASDLYLDKCNEHNWYTHARICGISKSTCIVIKDKGDIICPISVFHIDPPNCVNKWTYYNGVFIVSTRSNIVLTNMFLVFILQIQTLLLHTWCYVKKDNNICPHTLWVGYKALWTKFMFFDDILYF